jgi:RHS repeat-associated protein
LYDAAGNLLAEADGSSITRYYIHGLGLMAMVTPSGQVYCYHFNAIGSTIAMTDQSQAIVNKYAYDPFGNIANQEENLPQPPQPFKFVGQFGVMTEPNGFYYMRARYYDPDVGRFISEDPIGFSGGDENLYTYVGGNPVMGVDPWGKAAFWYHFFDGFRAGRAIGMGVGSSLKLGWATMMPDFNYLRSTPEAHTTRSNPRGSAQEAINNSLAYAASQWNLGTTEGQATAIHVWRDMASHSGAYFPDPASLSDYIAHTVQYDLLPGGSFQNVIGSRLNNPKP